MYIIKYKKFNFTSELYFYAGLLKRNTRSSKVGWLAIEFTGANRGFCYPGILHKYAPLQPIIID